MNRLNTRSDRVGGRLFETSYTTTTTATSRRLIYPSGGRVAYQYDQENRITRVTGGSLVFARDFDYHPSGAVQSFRAGNDLLTGSTTTSATG